MWCGKCNHELFECTCPDIEERLNSLRTSKHVASHFCRKCDKHHSQCRCETPEFYFPAEGFGNG